MSDLPNKHPDVHRQFVAGYHSVRRSERYWAGLPTDLIIEQVLMRSLKTSGGLTRGSGMSEQQRLVWLLSMPACADTNQAMQSLTNIHSKSGEQNKDMSNSRKQRDRKDTTILLSSLAQHTRFSSDPSLRNIMTGVNADSEVNVDSSLKIGKKILLSMSGKSVEEYSFSRKAQAVTMASRADW